MEFIQNLFKSEEKSKKENLAQQQVWLDKIKQHQQELSELNLEQLGRKTIEFRQQLAEGSLAVLRAEGLIGDTGLVEDISQNKEVLEKLEVAQERILKLFLPEAFAVVRQVSSLVMGKSHYDVQLLGGADLNEETVVEMKTGEGKTLMSTLAIYLDALALNPDWLQQAASGSSEISDWKFQEVDGVSVGRGVHVITANSYLAKRDANEMGLIYEKLGLKTGALGQGDRREAYLADITYGEADGFGHDYLRDHMAFSVEDRVQRGHFSVKVDEADSVLIDEAQVPLIISGPANKERAQQEVALINRVELIIRDLSPDHYEVDDSKKEVGLTVLGMHKLNEALGVAIHNPSLPEKISVEQLQLWGIVTQALRARFLFIEGRDYEVLPDEDGKDQVVITDEISGRLQAGRSWSDGLHQAVQAKEGLEVTPRQVTYAMISVQSYINLYAKKAGTTGTAAEVADELEEVYDLKVKELPSHLQYLLDQPNTTLVKVEGTDYYVDWRDPDKKRLFLERDDYEEKVLSTKKEKLEAILEEIRQMQREGRSVVIGTNHVYQSEELSEFLDSHKIDHKVLNAKNHTQEAEIIAQAGEPGSVVIATNMAGRGVDIELLEELRAVGGLHIIMSQPHPEERVLRQLSGRAGRQGDPGSSRLIICEEDLVAIPPHAAEDAQAAREQMWRYDQVLDVYRQRIYELSDKIVEKADVTEDLDRMMVSQVEKKMKELEKEFASLEPEKLAVKFLSWLENLRLSFSQGEGGEVEPSFALQVLLDKLSVESDRGEESSFVDRLLVLKKELVTAQQQSLRKAVKKMLFSKIVVEDRESIENIVADIGGLLGVSFTPDIKELVALKQRAELERVLVAAMEETEKVQLAAVESRLASLPTKEAWSEEELAKIVLLEDGRRDFKFDQDELSVIAKEVSKLPPTELSAAAQQHLQKTQTQLIASWGESKHGQSGLALLQKKYLFGLVTNAWADYLNQLDALRLAANQEGSAGRDPEVVYKEKSLELFDILIQGIEQQATQQSWRLQVL